MGRVDTEMWERGTCAQAGHVLTPESYAKRRCMVCKRTKNAAARRARKPARQWSYNEPRVVDADWQHRAICVGEDVNTFFPEPGGSGNAAAARAKRICLNCPVRRDCLAAALIEEAGERLLFGIRGGLSQLEREHVFDGRRSFEAELGIEGEPTVSKPLAAETVA